MVAVAFVIAFALCGAVVDAQQTGKVLRIGFLGNSTASGNAVLLEEFRQELSKLGWIEGNITIEYRFAEQKNVANRRKVYYLWRPFLKDPKDDMVLELAASAGCDIIVTYNKDDFKGVEQFGVRVMTAQEFLRAIGELP